MEEPEGALSFDFEGGLEAAPSNPIPSQQPLIPNDSSSIPLSNNNHSAIALSTQSDVVIGAGNRRSSFRQTVCRHWLRGLCMKGDACGFLHQYDKSRMPICRFFRLYGECREQDCVYKHTNEDVKECNMYKLGFCPNGPDCRYRHAKLPGPPPPVEEVLQKIQHLTSFNYGASNKIFQHRNPGYFQQGERFQPSPGLGMVNPGLKQPVTSESPNIQQQPSHIPQPQEQQNNQSQLQTFPDGQGNKNASPLPQGLSRYFVVKSCNRENLELSTQQGVWATQRSNEAKLNEAFDSAENVILIFSVNRTRHFQGCAKMTSKIGEISGGGNWKYAHGTAHYGRNFSVKWLKLCELSFHKTRHLRNPYNDNLPVKISRDCQELEPTVGQQLASLLYLEPDSELMAISVAAESKRKEEKAMGVNSNDGAENPDIVPFEDNEDEEEEESEEEDESFGQALGAGQGRGRGRGGMWPPQMPPGYGGRPIPGVRGFPPVMMGADGFSYGSVPPDRLPVPDFFPRPFAPYGPRFSGDFTGMGQNSAMGFAHGRPTQPGPFFPPNGLGMMGPGRAPFMGGMGMVGAGPFRANRPAMMPQFCPPGPPPPQDTNWVKKDQRRPTNERNTAGSEQAKGQEAASPDGAADDDARYQSGLKSQNKDLFGSGNRSGESESEDEAPRRSRR
ncbi:30-kDa cleavage and polyadenylation specificity factor [Thalictrum thalictroides]|uniref:30-kDa cleavage and polyadenylation specificity factor n=1 Tax=Thalictrum thalictroides TaxID=46969 RepID=A0A7J6WL68_THATH|nr:30-kDa cleavage and polyadenylation specificity factor [Thalictrum thalictroides]